VLLSTIHLNVRREISLVPLGHYGNCNLSKMPDATRVKQRTRETTAAVARCREPRDQPPQEGTPHPEVKNDRAGASSAGSPSLHFLGP
jgi:hypothetical protein